MENRSEQARAADARKAPEREAWPHPDTAAADTAPGCVPAAGGEGKSNGRFPAPVDLLVFFGIFLLAQGVGVLAALLCGSPWPDSSALFSADETGRYAAERATARFNAVSYFVAMSLTLLGFLYYRRRRRGPRIVARFSVKGFDPLLLLWGVLFMTATSVVLEPLLAWLPDVPPVYGRGGWAVATLVAMAPLFEETLFRGVLLESVRVRYGVMAAWIVSSLAFGIVHMHPTVMVNAFVIGLILGFVYLKASSLWPAIFLHAVNNGIAYLTLVAGRGNTLLIELVGDRTLYVTIYIAALAVFAVSGYMTWRMLVRLKAGAEKGAAA